MISNKVKRMKPVDINYQGYRLEKFSWKCTVCGRVYTLRRHAQSCQHIDIRGRYGLNYLYIDKQEKIPILNS